MILIHLYGVLLFFYVTFRLILPAPLPPRGKALAATLALLVSQYHLCVRFLSGSLSSPEMPYFVLAAFSAAFIVMTVIFALLLLRDGLRLGLLLVRKLTCRRSTPFSPGRRAVALAGLGLTVGAYGFKEALRIPAVKTTEIFLRRLPAALHGLVVVQLTDLHASALLHAPRVAAIVAAVNALRPDLIVCTGDLVDGTPPTGTPTWPRWGCCAPATGCMPARATTNIMPTMPAGCGILPPWACPSCTTLIRLWTLGEPPWSLRPQ